MSDFKQVMVRSSMNIIHRLGAEYLAVVCASYNANSNTRFPL